MSWQTLLGNLHTKEKIEASKFVAEAKGNQKQKATCIISDYVPQTCCPPHFLPLFAAKKGIPIIFIICFTLGTTISSLHPSILELHTCGQHTA
ncbi:transmembrane protein, putative [Medicago truncatula]|uniref:Transmembrane protein, putative n=1 Tax=Medicago truncatula TaxID=3880 RepID=A0A072VLP2_MEDTR|nr:transmembrane protein, putative [Medicago truncatula]